MPTLKNTTSWTRLQRKFLPKYLFVVDDVAAVQLLKCAARLQPPIIASLQPGGEAVSTIAGVAAQADQDATPQAEPPHQHNWQPQQWLSAATGLKTSINGSLQRRYAASASSSSNAAIKDSLTALDAAAAARGFQTAVDERAEFELMMSAVYAVMADKLQGWHQSCVMQLLPYSAQLQIRSEGFMQVRAINSSKLDKHAKWVFNMQEQQLFRMLVGCAAL
jgi:hypothetical protein